jgi:hypothetical protein
VKNLGQDSDRQQYDPDRHQNDVDPHHKIASADENQIQRNTLCMGTCAGADYNSPYVDSNTFTMGNPMLESTLSPSQGFRIWPQRILSRRQALKTMDPALCTCNSMTEHLN